MRSARRVPFFEADREFGPDIADAVSMVRDGALVEAAESVTGPLGLATGQALTRRPSRRQFATDERRHHRVVTGTVGDLRERRFFQQQEIGALARLQRAQPVVEAQDPCRVRGGGA